MLLVLLLHLLIIHLLTARDAPTRKDTQYIIEHIETCPKVGYYFKRQSSPNHVESGTCYLCFCQEDNTAVCWKRDNRRCNVESFHYHGVGKRDTRIRRSPGFADIFFRDASRDVFNKNEKTQCKPFESSFSDDCPPADWCIGCTVCDCDAHGRWDCHVLSFCPDDKGKKKSKRKGSMRKIVAKKPVSKSKSTDSIGTWPMSTTVNAPTKTKSTNKAKTKTPPSILRGGNSQVPPQKRVVKKSVPVKPSLTSRANQKKRNTVRYKRISPRKPNDTKTKEIIIKKNVATHKPIDINVSKGTLEREIAQQMMKKVMGNLRNSIKDEVEAMSQMAYGVAQQAVNQKVKNKQTKRQVKKTQKTLSQRRSKHRPTRKPVQKFFKKPIKKPVKKPGKKPTRKPTGKPPPKTNIRNKRDAIVAGDTNTNTSTIDAQESNADLTNMPVAVSTTTNNLLTSHDVNSSHTLIESSTLPENEYYKYVVGIAEPEIEIERPIKDKEITKVNITETVINLIGSDMTPNILINRSDSDNNGNINTYNLSKINPETNNVKYSKRTHLKIIKHKKFKEGYEKRQSLIKIITPANKTVIEDYKNKVHSKDVERKFNNKKYNLVKILNHQAKSRQNNNDSSIQMATRQIGDLQNLLPKLLRELHKNSTTDAPQKRKFSFIRYLKRLFKKVFKHKNTSHGFSSHHIVATLCENFGPCKVSTKDKVLLKNKLADLDVETKKIVTTVRIIKGLLKLLNLPKSADLESSKYENFQSDVQKLNNILKGSYVTDDKVSLSATQLTQIAYIKSNAQEFIKSVSKLALLLNEIIVILSKHGTNISKNANRMSRNIFTGKNCTKADPFQSLKYLLVRYNSIQNHFMKRVYEHLNNVEYKMNEKSKVSEVKDFNNSVAINKFSRDIIQNLRKLKGLAQTLSYSGRSKRDTMRDDDAIEYLLMLMEYLLKQNHPLDAAPVNDGIDLLIEAIKNAPDIKPIKKKVLEYSPATFFDITTTPYTTSVNTGGSVNDNESPSDSDKTSTEENGKDKLDDMEDTLKIKTEDTKDLGEIMIEDDKDPEDKFQFDRRAGLDKLDEITEVGLYKRVKDNFVLQSENAIVTTSTPPLEIEISEKTDKEEFLDNITRDKQIAEENHNLDKQIVEEYNYVDKSNGDGGIDDKKIEVLTADMDEEIILPGTMAITVSEKPTINTEISTQTKKSRAKMRHPNLESINSEGTDKKSKLEWIEENFGRENEKEFTDFEENNTTIAFTVKPQLSSVTTDKVDSSGLTREVIDETDKKRKAKLNAEDVMLRKQMDLLNSLDYGTERAEIEESDSKDGAVDDRYLSDTFPSYFV